MCSPEHYVTVNRAVRVTVLPSVLVYRAVYKPGVAPAGMSKVKITCEGETTFTDDGVIVVTGALALVNTTAIPGCR